MSEDHIFKFPTDLKTGNAICYNVGRMHLASGECVRVLFTPGGIRLVLPKSCKDNGDIIWNTNPDLTLGEWAKQECDKEKNKK